MLEAYQNHYSVWLMHLLYILATLFDIVVGYWIGKIFHDRFAKSRFSNYARRKMDEFSEMSGKYGKKIALIVFGPIIFPISAVLAPWLEVSFVDALIFFLIGDVIFWYAFEWLAVLGIKSVIPDPTLALYALVALIIVIIIAIRHGKIKRMK